jgi:threonine dehydrogenase-like Zn-dependent dehydrogenase
MADNPPTIRSLVLPRPRSAEIVEQPAKLPTVPELTVSVDAFALSDSDLETFVRSESHAKEPIRYPRIPGRLAVGTVISGTRLPAGKRILPFSKNSQELLLPGTRVLLKPWLPCGQCLPCSRGESEQCTTPRLRGRDVDGFAREQVALSPDSLLSVSEKISTADVLFAEEIGLALEAFSRLELREGDRLLLIGATAASLVAILMARSHGIETYLADVNVAKLELARSLGADHVINPLNGYLAEEVEWYSKGALADGALLSYYAPTTLSLAVDAVRPGTSLMILNGYDGRVEDKDGAPVGTSEGIASRSRRKGLQLLSPRPWWPDVNQVIYEFALLISPPKLEPLVSNSLQLESIPLMLPMLAENPGDYLKVVCELSS